MRRALRAFAVFLSISLVSACGGSGSSAPASPADTTVLVYIVGSDLERKWEAASGNLIEMMDVGSQPGRMNVIVQTGGANDTGLGANPGPSDMTPYDIDWTHVQRYVVNHGSLTRLDDLGVESVANPALNMGSGVTLANFLDWGVASYPAKKYIVVLWDHGGGVNGGFGSDEVTASVLSVPTLSEALTSVAVAHDVTFELVGFDACLMATMEVAASLAASSDFLVASEDLEPGSGWNWTTFLRYVLANPTATGKEIGIAIADGYAEKQKAAGEDITLSVVDLSTLDALSTAVDDFSTALAPYGNGTRGRAGWMAIAKARSVSLDWGTSAFYGGSDDLVDAFDLVSNVRDQVNEAIGYDDVLTGAADRLLAAIDDAVAYNVTTGPNALASGLTLYFPSVLSSYPEKGYTLNTSVNGVPYFAPKYTNSSGFAKSYFDTYLSNPGDLQATVTMSGTPADPLGAVVNNDYDNVLAAHQTANCTFWTSVLRREVRLSGPCYDAAQVVEGVKSATANEWRVTFTYGGPWPRVSGSGGGGAPVFLLPDQYAATKLAQLNSYLIPAWQKYTDPKTQEVSWDQGFLTVDEYYPQVPGPRALKVTGFRPSATVPGKSTPLKNDTFALGVYANDGLGNAFFRTDTLVTARDGVLTMGTTTLSGESFGYILTDLTGTVSSSNVVPYAPAR